MKPQSFQSRWRIWAAVNVLALLPPLAVWLVFAGRDDYVYDFAYALAAKWTLISLTILSMALWGLILTMRAWKRRGGGSSAYRLTAGALNGLVIAVVTVIAALLVAEFLSPLYLPAFNELSGLHQVEDDPELMFSLKPGSRQSYRVLSTGEKVEYRINRHGFRGPDFNIQKPEGVTRVLTIGDSMTFGLDTNIEDTYPALLQSKLNASQGNAGAIEVINGGVSGYNTWNEVNFLEKRGLALTPDIIVFQFCFNDTGDPISLISAISYFHFKSLPAAMFPSPELVSQHEETILTINRKTMTLKTAMMFTLRKHSRLFGYFNRAWAGWKNQRQAPAMPPDSPIAGDSDSAPRSHFHDALISLSRTDTPEFAWLRANLERLKVIADAQNLSVVFLVPPIRLQITGDNDAYNEAYRNVVNLAREMNFAVCAPLPALRNAAGDDPSRLYIGPDEIHFNRMGNEILADELRKEILNILNGSGGR